MKYETRQFADAVVMTPATPASASVIWMHGLGADGTDFLPLVPELQLPDAVAPRFIFPNAPVRPVTVNNGMAMRAWYDIYSTSIRDREDAAGIRASAAAVHGLIDRECAAGISAQRIVLAGFSQGGAIALHAGLRFRTPLAGILALSTYLPLASTLTAESGTANHAIPILMCHGLHDPIVPLDLARKSLATLQAQGYAPQLLEYPMQHSLCAEEVLEISRWLVRVLPAL
ncbi:MAG TPA: alpha/beta fold hydrolase [Steroidobacteraceae bacterium]|nr:alpha/beta fold hydrolase [Steroidobacteraceae bacterium]